LNADIPLCLVLTFNACLQDHEVQSVLSDYSAPDDASSLHERSGYTRRDSTKWLAEQGLGVRQISSA